MSLLPIVILAEDTSRQPEASSLAERLHLPIVSHYQEDVIHLVLTKEHIELKWPGKSLNPLFIDFQRPHQQLRLKQNKGRRELIAKAVGVKGAYLPAIIDATAGFGGDAIILASLGCQMILLERSPVIYTLLEDGMRRVRESSPDGLPNLRLQGGDAKDYLQRCINDNSFPDVVYLDPMFPQRTKHALVKKEMRLLKELVGGDEDASMLFALARRCAIKRVVVKRPRLAPSITNEPPDITYTGKVCRFDVYLGEIKSNPQED